MYIQFILQRYQLNIKIIYIIVDGSFFYHYIHEFNIVFIQGLCKFMRFLRVICRNRNRKNVLYRVSLSIRRYYFYSFIKFINAYFFRVITHVFNCVNQNIIAAYQINVLLISCDRKLVLPVSGVVNFRHTYYNVKTCLIYGW